MAICSKYNKVFYSFTRVCESLESQAAHEKSIIDKEVKNYFHKAKNVANEVSEVSSNIRETCQGIKLTNVWYDYENPSTGDEYLQLPYILQADTVECLKNVFRCDPLSGNELENRLTITQEEMARGIIRTAEYNTFDLDNFHILKLL